MENNNELKNMNNVLSMVTEMDLLAEFAEYYRLRLVEHYKMLLFEGYADDLAEELMREAVMVMDASVEEILEMFVEDSNDRWVDMDTQAFFNQFFEEAIPSP